MTETAQKDYEYRVRHNLGGGHVHCRVFSRREGTDTWAKCGDLTLAATEFASFDRALIGAEFIDEDF